MAHDSVYNSYEDYILENPLQIEAGHIEIPDEPGLAAVDKQKVAKYRLD